MNLLQNPTFLKYHDSYYYSDFKDPDFGKNQTYQIVKKSFSYRHQYERKSHFSPLSNPHVMIIAYVEKDPMCLNLFGMPAKIQNYEKLDKSLDKKLSNESKVVYVEDDEDLPLLFHLEKGTPITIQETNAFSSVLINVDREESGDLYILSFFDNKSTVFLTKPEFKFVSGHIQPKIEIEITFPKQERIYLNKERERIYKTVKENLDNKIKVKIPEMILQKIPLIQIKSLRERRIEEEIKKIRTFFHHLLETKTFNDENNLIIILYAISCFPLHNSKMIKILKRIEKFLNQMYWTQSINFFHVFDQSKLGKNFFSISLLKIFRMYFDEKKLCEFDDRLFLYLKQFGKENYTKVPNSNKNILKKKKYFIETKKQIIKLVYFLEYQYLIGIRFNNEMFCSFMDKVLPNHASNVTEEDFLSLDIEIMQSMENMENMENIENDKNMKHQVGYKVYEQDLKKIEKSSLFRIFYRNKKISNQNKRLKTTKTRKSQIRYSEIFTEKSPHVLHLHPNVIKNFSNVFSVFMQYNYKNYLMSSGKKDVRRKRKRQDLNEDKKIDTRKTKKRKTKL